MTPHERLLSRQKRRMGCLARLWPAAYAFECAIATVVQCNEWQRLITMGEDYQLFVVGENDWTMYGEHGEINEDGNDTMEGKNEYER